MAEKEKTLVLARNQEEEEHFLNYHCGRGSKTSWELAPAREVEKRSGCVKKNEVPEDESFACCNENQASVQHKRTSAAVVVAIRKMAELTVW